MRSILAIFCVFSLMACAEDKINSLPTPSEEEESNAPLIEGPSEIYAEKSYGPSQWVDYTKSFEQVLSLRLADMAEVVKGQSGNHWLSLKLANDVDSIICIYKGTGARSKTKGVCDNDNGDSYAFEYCISRQSYADYNCASNPFKSNCIFAATDLLSGDVVDVNYIELSISNGDSCATTKVKMTL